MDKDKLKLVQNSVSRADKNSFRHYHIAVFFEGIIFRESGLPTFSRMLISRFGPATQRGRVRRARKCKVCVFNFREQPKGSRNLLPSEKKRYMVSLISRSDVY